MRVALSLDLLSRGANANTVIRLNGPVSAEPVLVYIARCQPGMHRGRNVDPGLRIAKALLDYGADVDGRDYIGDTPLMFAASNGDTNMVRLLLDHRADVNARGFSGVTAISNAAAENRSAIVLMLIQKGANMNAVTEHQDALDVAAMEGAAAAEAVLLNHGAGTPASRYGALAIGALSDRADIVRMLLRAGVPANKPAGLDPAIVSAVQGGDLSIVRLLLRNGADINARDASGRSALMWATESPAMTRFLLAHGAKVNIREPGVNGHTALDLAEFDEHPHHWTVWRILKNAGGLPGRQPAPK
ncbi:MAG TPA: ankyrin repeat domain-containing protein [Chthonomonadales bacterium]|nr:ankyrin repeat domain-containing protein [Chthonomonadales bacterium]